LNWKKADMEKEKMESMMIEFVDGTLSEADRRLIEQELNRNPEAVLLERQIRETIEAMKRSSDPIEPSHSMKSRFEKELQALMADERRVNIVPARRNYFYRIAAAVAFVLTVGASFYWISKGVEQERELAKLKTEMEQTKLMMMAMLGNQSSAGQRIQGASVVYKMDEADDDIVNALAKTLNTDPNTNVRLAALDALSQFQQQPEVRYALIQSLSIQIDPAVQIALIRLLVEIKETQTLNELKRISTDENVLPAVQDEAHAGILILS
jgi:HEAT repeats